MKIILGCIVGFFCFSVSFAQSFAIDCEYTKDMGFLRDGEVGDFIYTFNIKICEAHKPLDEEAIQYIRDIRKIQGKKPVEMIRGIGEKFCRGVFCPITEIPSLYARYQGACATAYQEAIGTMSAEQRNTVINSNNSLLIWTIGDGCLGLADKKLIAYKAAATGVVNRHHVSSIVDSTAQYVTEQSKKSELVSNMQVRLLKMLGNIASVFEGFTRSVFGY